LAEPEADPAYVLNNGVLTYAAGAPIVPTVYNTVPVVYNRQLVYSGVPVVVKQDVATPEVVPAVVKQDVATPEVPEKAEEEAPEAPEKPEEKNVVIPAPYAYPGFFPQVVTPYVIPAPVVPNYYAYSAGGVKKVVAKREAESSADAAYYYNPYGYAYGGYGLPYAYGYGFRPYGLFY